ncbi:CPBP family intramembrane glutamic endopeptidase [Aquimarina sp. 2201CG5-10]|uniref:CPBP family intramembrane glutamic endopeptidase n=1 Tax=Aquimarina callyspongiae TaxID=3098150 RepID=UPI002AB52805|nr:CPBP family intramembrane glutamic endopeptidase [Aquimarina sp. 2201CG5-10]MDY8138380.1 CPBP family intramembrane glutamic endopeptidase [Aquimarina sp. 2201CG5-10]
MSSTYIRGLELFLLFVLLPVSFLLNYPIQIKIGFTLIGFVYILILLKRSGLLKFRFPGKEYWKPFWKATVIKLLVVIVVTTLYVTWIAPDKLFSVLVKKPELWIIILFVYTFLSVWPQEIIYRTFFYDRYERLVSNKWLLIFINALLFSLAHIFLKSFLVQLLTFIGGLLFAFTYQKTKSTTLVSIEHAIYGNWLFTVGMGEMLAFPGAE